MLQQTQVARATQKFEQFVDELPDFAALATVSTPRLLELWQGLGYNRRALYLKKIAVAVTGEYGGTLPADPAELVKLSGIGSNTAGSIAAFAYNAPVVFIETNIRRVFIHHCFADADEVHDRDIMPLLEQALDREHSREWYYALMDYGSHLAKTLPNPNRRSTHYARQSKFEGSDRQLRGEILRRLLQAGSLSVDGLATMLNEKDDRRVTKIVQTLKNDNFIVQTESGHITLVQ